MTGLQAALAEATGDGNFTITGRRLIYTCGKFEFKWDCKNKADAASSGLLRLPTPELASVNIQSPSGGNGKHFEAGGRLHQPAERIERRRWCR
jgi:hypothetical protein